MNDDEDDDCFIVNTETSCSSLNNDPGILSIVQDGRLSSRVPSRADLAAGGGAGGQDITATTAAAKLDAQYQSAQRRKQIKALLVFISIGIAIAAVVVLFETLIV